LTHELVPPSLEATAPAAPYSVDEPYVIDDFAPASDFGEVAPGCDSADGYGGEMGCFDEPAPIYSTGTWFGRGDVFTTQEVLVWVKDNPRTPNLGSSPGEIEIPAELTLIGNNLAIGAGDISQRATPGARLSIGRFMGRDAGNRDHSFDFNFTGLFEWDVELTTGAPPNNSLDTGLGAASVGFQNVTEHRYLYTSDYDSFEMNYRVRTRPGKDQMALQPDGNWVRFKNSSQVRMALFGMRFTSINDAVQFEGRGQELDNNNMPLAVQRFGTYRVLTNNDLVGPQIGAELTETFDQWNWGLRTKVGSLYNFAARRSAVNVTNADLGRQERTNDGQISFIFEGGIFGSYQVRPNLFIRAGYDVMYITGIGLAPENMGLISNTAFPAFNVTGDSLYHGGSLGFETYW
jgi:hypothetical protein